LLSSEQEFKLPDPNTQPILYGNNYPGPGEPLYQPKPDEQIWLTDLDGHADIYDNDSIKINYAPGFNKSQITKIDVYRNEIKLRFLLEIFDVLTNAQMKTFDGNPAEHSPASNHTDHAIMGYEYKFEIHTADDLWILKKTVKSGFRWHPKEVWAQLGISWAWRSIDEISLDDLVHFLEYLKDDGFTGIECDVPYYVDTPFDNAVFKLYDRDSEIGNWDIRTPTIAELEKMLKATTEAKLEVNIRGHIYISRKYQDEHGVVYGGAIVPTDPAKFFKSYTDAWWTFIPLLNKYHVKLLTPFVEMDKLELHFPHYIKQMYTEISEACGSEMGLDEATNTMLDGNSSINSARIYTRSEFERLVSNFTFWNWRDSQKRPIRIEYSCWSPPVETQKDQRTSAMAKNFAEFWKTAAECYNLLYPRDPQMFGEIGAFNADGQSLGSDYYYNVPSAQRVMDEQERADYILAALRGSEELNTIMAITLWGSFTTGDVWPSEPGSLNIRTGHYDYPASPMYKVFKAVIKQE
jgi:hypothetical protein